VPSEEDCKIVQITAFIVVVEVVVVVVAIAVIVE
jgi:hypothetical protein